MRTPTTSSNAPRPSSRATNRPAAPLLLQCTPSTSSSPPVHCSKDHDHAQRRRRRRRRRRVPPPRRRRGRRRGSTRTRQRPQPASRRQRRGKPAPPAWGEKAPECENPSSSPNKALPQKCDPIHSPQRVVACRGTRRCRGIHDWAPVFKGVVRVRARARRQVLPHEVVPQRGGSYSAGPWGAARAAAYAPSSRA